MIHDNMLPEIKMIVPRKDVKNLDTLVTLARDSEKLVHYRDKYKPPPLPERSLLPHFAYKEKPAVIDAKEKAPSVNAVEVLPKTDLQSLRAQIASVQETLAQMNIANRDARRPTPLKSITTGDSDSKYRRKNQQKNSLTAAIQEVADGKPKRPPHHTFSATVPLQHTIYICPECLVKSEKDSGKK